MPAPSRIVEEQRRQARERLQAKVADSASLDEAGRQQLAAEIELQRAQEEAWARGDAEAERDSGPARLADRLPGAVKVVAAPKVPGFRVNQADRRRFRRTQSEWNEQYNDVLRAGHAAAEARPTGENIPLEAILKRTVDVLIRLGRYTAGKVEITFKELAKKIGCSVDVAFRAIHYLRDKMLDLMPGRARGIDRNGKPGLLVIANVYVLRRPEPQDADPATDEAGRLARWAARVRRATEWFGMHIRSSGFLNTTPERVRTPPEPA